MVSYLHIWTNTDNAYKITRLLEEERITSAKNKPALERLHTDKKTLEVARDYFIFLTVIAVIGVGASLRYLPLKIGFPCALLFTIIGIISIIQARRFHNSSLKINKLISSSVL